MGAITRNITIGLGNSNVDRMNAGMTLSAGITVAPASFSKKYPAPTSSMKSM
jgi:hypothetical protein